MSAYGLPTMRCALLVMVLLVSAAGSGSAGHAVEDALAFLRRQQLGDGSWRDDPAASDQQATATTAFACLAYLGAGYDHLTPNKYRTTVRNGLTWLTTAPSASFQDTASVAVRAMVLAEAYAMTNHPDLRQPAQGAIDDVLRCRRALGAVPGMAWRQGSEEAHDVRVSALAIMALYSARAGGLDIRNGLDTAEDWWGYVIEWVAVGRHPYPDRLVLSSSGAPEPRGSSGAAALLASGAFIHRDAFASEQLAAQPEWTRLLETVLAQPILTEDGSLCDPADLWWSGLGMIRAGGPYWMVYHRPMLDGLLDRQYRGGGDPNGSWPAPDGPLVPGLPAAGDVSTTAVRALTLEIFYRHAARQGQR